MRVAVLLTLLAVWNCAGGAADPVHELHDAVAARLLLMEDVARFKWNAQLPIADQEREAALLARVTHVAVELGVPEAYARRVIAAQMEAARAIQTSLFEQWRAARHGPFAAVPDLAEVQRPRIDRATTRLLTALAHTRCALDAGDVRQSFTAAPTQLTEFSAAWDVATAALFSAGACVSRPSPPAGCG
jgi:chorismate mutase-like protein